MGGGGGGGGGGGTKARELDETPTWAVASVCAVIVLVSIVLEKVIHHFELVFEEKKKKALLEALEKIKGELMVLGFISLILTFGQNYIASMCIPLKYADTMLPCPLGGHDGVAQHGHGHPPSAADHGSHQGARAGDHGVPAADQHAVPATDQGPHGEDDGGKVDHHRRRLLYYERRFLASDSAAVACKQGYVPLISLNGLHQLHIFIFFLAVFHVIYSAITMMLGRLKIRGWKEWERENEADQEAMNDPKRFRLTHEVSFVRDHNSIWTKTPVSFYLVCFFRQFFRSVRRADYLTMRHGFVTVHLAPGSKFDFQKYIKRSMEDDFKVVVGISPILWASVVLFLLVNVHGWHAFLWVSMLPLVVILAVGTKLQGIITRMALDIKEKHAVVQGIPLVQVSDKYFWFEWPPLVLYLIHFVLFQNAFELTYFLWIWYEFGWDSCFHDDINIAIVRVCLGIGAQFVCSYVTLPLYALVTQMGSTMKKSIFDEQTSKALKQWHKNAQNKKNPKPRSPTRTLGGSPRSPTHSPAGAQSKITPDSATIITNVDLPGNQQDTSNSYHDRDLLSGP